MFNKQITRLISKLKKDFKSIHQINISEEFVKENFIFHFKKNKLSESGLNRIFSFAEYIYKNEERISKINKNDMWTEFSKSEDHINLKKISN